MKRVLFVLLCVSVVLISCAQSSAVTDAEKSQQVAGNLAIVTNQPVIDLGGYSFERQIINETYAARNQAVAMWTYQLTFEGKIIEICASLGYPVPYSTQLTNPWKYEYTGSGPAVVANAEPNSLYAPSDAAATFVQCVNDDGSVSPIYWEPELFSLPYRIKSDFRLERIGDPSYTIEPSRGVGN
jgi:hypothetical protein